MLESSNSKSISTDADESGEAVRNLQERPRDDNRAYNAIYGECQLVLDVYQR